MTDRYKNTEKLLTNKRPIFWMKQHRVNKKHRHPGHLIVIMGPTASGKSALAVRLARHFATEIVSADARQIYAGMSIGTGVPSASEQAGVRHHFLGTQAPDEPLSAGAFAALARRCLRKLFHDHETVILVGGSGLYLEAICAGLSPAASPLRAARNHWRAQPLSLLQAYVAQHDPKHYAQMDTSNRHRLSRAAECIAATGGGDAVSHAHSIAPEPMAQKIHYIGLLWPRKELYARIERRCHHMLERGLLKEALKLYEQYTPSRLPPTIGYDECFDYFANRCTLKEAKERFLTNSRRYAKRQLTWLRHRPQLYWCWGKQPETAETYASALLN